MVAYLFDKRTQLWGAMIARPLLDYTDIIPCIHSLEKLKQLIGSVAQ